jgi:hypothetical protein
LLGHVAKSAPPPLPRHAVPPLHRICNLRVTKVNGNIVLDPHVAGCCVITLDTDQASALRDTLTEWLS